MALISSAAGRGRARTSTAQDKTVLIYNPRAGKLNGRGERALRPATEKLERAGHDLRLVPTMGPGTAADLAREAAGSGASMVVVAGGDGTINEVLPGLVHTPVPLAILPAGTANVLATEMGLPDRLDAAAARLADCVPCRIPVGRVRYHGSDLPPRYFLLMAGAGVDARVVYRVSVPLKARVGKIAYWIAGFSLAGRTLDEFEVTADGRTHVCSFALVSKVRNYGGDFQIARDTSLFDNRFEVVLFAGRSSFRYLKYLAGVALKRVSGLRGVTVLRAAEVKLAGAAGRRIHIQVDGESAGCLPATVEVVPEALTLLVPPTYAGRVAP